MTPTQPVTPIVDQPAPQAPGPVTPVPISEPISTALMSVLNLILTIVTAIIMIIALVSIPAAGRNGRNARVPLRLLTKVRVSGDGLILSHSKCDKIRPSPLTRTFGGQIIAFDGKTVLFAIILVVTIVLAAIAAKGAPAEAKE